MRFLRFFLRAGFFQALHRVLFQLDAVDTGVLAGGGDHQHVAVHGGRAFHIAFPLQGGALRAGFGLQQVQLARAFGLYQPGVAGGVVNGHGAGYACTGHGEGPLEAAGGLVQRKERRALGAVGQGRWQGDMNAVIASCSEYTYLTQGKRIDGTMYSCTSLGVKIGGGIGTAVCGWLLELSGYVGTNATQPQSALDMMQFMYLWLPLIFDVLIMIVLSRMNVEAANEKLKAEKGIKSDEVTDATEY